MDLETIRSLALGVLKAPDLDQMWQIQNAVTELAMKTGLLSAEQRQAEGIHAQYADRLAPGEESKIREVIWELIIAGVLTPGCNDSNPNLPFLRLTDWGRECVNAAQLVPYDRDGYIRQLLAGCPALDPIARDYVFEALECFRRGCLLAAPVMLGCASENTAIRLMETFGAAIADPARKAAYEKKMAQMGIKRRFDHFRAELGKVSLPANISDALDIHLDGIFTLLRYARNDTGHPTGSKIPRAQVFTNFTVFVGYCQRAYALMEWLQANPV